MILKAPIFIGFAWLHAILFLRIFLAFIEVNSDVIFISFALALPVINGMSGFTFSISFPHQSQNWIP